MAFLSKYTGVSSSIIRPPRDTYVVKDLGPTVFAIKARTYVRADFTLKNCRGQSLACSHYEPIASERPAHHLPCIIYLHGNSSSRREALGVLPILLPCHFTVLSFDFAGSGCSDGQYISLGYFERDDLAAVIEYVRESNRTSSIGLLGRSMGAVTALLHTDRDASVGALVLDSPFCDLETLARERVDTAAPFRVPRWILSMALSFVRSSVQDLAHFDISTLKPIEHAPRSYVPALFVAAHDDTFIHPWHVRKLYDAYAGDKNFVIIEGTHMSVRPRCFMESIAMFFIRALHCDTFSHIPRDASLSVGAVQDSDQSDDKESLP